MAYGVGDGGAVVAEDSGLALGGGLDGHDFGVLDGFVGTEPEVLDDGGGGEDDGARHLVEEESEDQDEEDGHPHRHVVLMGEDGVKDEGEIEREDEITRPGDGGFCGEGQAFGGLFGRALGHAGAEYEDDHDDEEDGSYILRVEMDGAEVHGLLSFERWRGVVGELLLLFGGAFYADVAEEE